MAASRTTASGGNQLAVTHGAQSEAIVALSSVHSGNEIEAAVAESGNYFVSADSFLIERASRQLGRLRLLDDYLDRMGGPIDSRGRPRKCLTLLMSLERQFERTCTALGLSPLARAQLLGDVAGARRGEAARSAQRELVERYGGVGRG
jgi:hypothetical protein